MDYMEIYIMMEMFGEIFKLQDLCCSHIRMA